LRTALSKGAGTWLDPWVASDLVADITELKQLDGKFILAHGGANFAQALVQHGLIDEYRLVIHPVAIGKGISLFASTPTQIDLKLESSTQFASGVIATIYSTIRK